MTIFTGTADGVFILDPADAANGSDAAAAPTRLVLEAPAVRELAEINGRIFAGSANGLYSSDDQGETWTRRGLVDYEVWQIRAGRDGRIIAGTQPAGLFRSDDGGDTWSEIHAFGQAPEASSWCVPLDPPLPGRARALVIDDEDPDRMWVGVEVGGVMRTVDGGESWEFDRPGGNPDLHMMFAHPTEKGVLFASTGYGREDHIAEEIEPNAGVFRSDDAGQTWEYAWKGITPRYSRPMCIDPRPPHSLTVGSAPNAFSNHGQPDGAGAMLFRSDDHGRSWRSLCDQAHSPSSANFHGLIIDPNTPGGVLVGTDTGELWQVDDDASWTPLASGMPHVWTALVTA